MVFRNDGFSKTCKLAGSNILIEKEKRTRSWSKHKLALNIVLWEKNCTQVLQTYYYSIISWPKDICASNANESTTEGAAHGPIHSTHNIRLLKCLSGV